MAVVANRSGSSGSGKINESILAQMTGSPGMTRQPDDDADGLRSGGAAAGRWPTSTA